jgi:AraC family transcriptional regulator of adaptative response/methylated-DNA-[protein]-cysteine methyltransferase
MNDYQQMAKVINYLSAHAKEQPTLDLLADLAGLSPYHFQRKFSAWVGVSPKSYLQCLNLENARGLLHQGNTVLDVAVDSGLSGPGRLHDLCVTLDAATPGEIKTGGEGLVITYGFGATPFGECMLGNSSRGICYLAFIDKNGHEQALKELTAMWPNATLKHQQKHSMAVIMQIFNLERLEEVPPLRAYVKGTRFQLRVWRALLQIPEGRLVSYGELAARISQPSAARAVGSAVAANSLAYLIPCHRVIRSTGITTGYRWGSERKRTIIACERARTMTS